MIKLTVRYADEAELREFLPPLLVNYSVKVHPGLPKPVPKNPKTGLYCRKITLKKSLYKSGKV
jgi:hypothetical protein